jgi:hypothetical protein
VCWLYTYTKTHKNIKEKKIFEIKTWKKNYTQLCCYLVALETSPKPRGTENHSAAKDLCEAISLAATKTGSNGSYLPRTEGC